MRSHGFPERPYKWSRGRSHGRSHERQRGGRALAAVPLLRAVRGLERRGERALRRVELHEPFGGQVADEVVHVDREMRRDGIAEDDDAQIEAQPDAIKKKVDGETLKVSDKLGQIKEEKEESWEEMRAAGPVVGSLESAFGPSPSCSSPLSAYSLEELPAASCSVMKTSASVPPKTPSSATSTA